MVPLEDGAEVLDLDTYARYTWRNGMKLLVDPWDRRIHYVPKDWNIPFPVVTIQGSEEQVRLAWGIRALPWLILTDARHVITAQGPDVAALVRRLNPSGP